MKQEATYTIINRRPTHPWWTEKETKDFIEHAKRYKEKKEEEQRQQQLEHYLSALNIKPHEHRD